MLKQAVLSHRLVLGQTRCAAAAFSPLPCLVCVARHSFLSLSLSRNFCASLLPLLSLSLCDLSLSLFKLSISWLRVRYYLGCWHYFRHSVHFFHSISLSLSRIFASLTLSIYYFSLSMCVYDVSLIQYFIFRWCFFSALKMWCFRHFLLLLCSTNTLFCLHSGLRKIIQVVGELGYY